MSSGHSLASLWLGIFQLGPLDTGENILAVKEDEHWEELEISVKGPEQLPTDSSKTRVKDAYGNVADRTLVQTHSVDCNAASSMGRADGRKPVKMQSAISD